MLLLRIFIWLLVASLGGYDKPVYAEDVEPRQQQLRVITLTPTLVETPSHSNASPSPTPQISTKTLQEPAPWPFLFVVGILAIFAITMLLPLFKGLNNSWVIYYDQSDVVSSLNPYSAIKTSILDNQSTRVGWVVGFFKCFVAWLGTVKLLAALGSIFDGKTRRGGAIKSMAQLIVMRWVAKFLINGPVVYKRQGRIPR